jgi:hypothetical protein
MPIPEGHYRELKHGRKFNPRERWIVPAAVAVFVAIAIAAGIAISVDGKAHKSHAGCINVSAATAIGGSDLYRCGSQARALCTAPAPAGHSHNFLAFRRALADACRKAGLPVPAVPS